jgi:hypothetical protein
MMLTDEEIMDIRNRAKLNSSRQIDPLPFARDVIKAVLAKAGEHEPDIEKLGDQLANAEIAIQSLLEQKPAYRMGYQYDEGNEDPDLGGDLVLYQLDGKDYPVGTLFYAHPLPAQEIPEGWKEDWKKNVMQLWMCARKHDSSIPDDQLDYMRDMLLSASPKPDKS